MTIRLAKSVRVAWLLLAAMGCGWAQQPPDAAKSANEMRREQTRQVIAASPACQKAIANPKTNAAHDYTVPAAALIPNLRSLMEKSDEVVLTSSLVDGFDAIAPSGEDAVEYVDVKVLQSWKGSHKPGDRITFEIPTATLGCSLKPFTGEPHFSTFTGPGLWQNISGSVPMVLFLRRCQGSETLLTPGLRLTGAAVQGMFQINFPVPPGSHGTFPPEQSGCLNNISAGKYPADSAQCLAYLRSSGDPILIAYRADPLLKEYDGMAIGDFLTKVQELSDSLGYEPPQ